MELTSLVQVQVKDEESTTIKNEEKRGTSSMLRSGLKQTPRPLASLELGLLLAEMAHDTEASTSTTSWSVRACVARESKPKDTGRRTRTNTIPCGIKAEAAG